MLSLCLSLFKSYLRSDHGCIQSGQSSGACGDFAAERIKKGVYCFVLFFSSSLSFLLLLSSDKYLKRSNPNEGTEAQVPEGLRAAAEPGSFVRLNEIRSPVSRKTGELCKLTPGSCSPFS